MSRGLSRGMTPRCSSSTYLPDTTSSSRLVLPESLRGPRNMTSVTEHCSDVRTVTWTARACGVGSASIHCAQAHGVRSPGLMPSRLGVDRQAAGRRPCHPRAARCASRRRRPRPRPERAGSCRPRRASRWISPRSPLAFEVGHRRGLLSTVKGSLIASAVRSSPSGLPRRIRGDHAHDDGVRERARSCPSCRSEHRDRRASTIQALPDSIAPRSGSASGSPLGSVPCHCAVRRPRAQAGRPRRPCGLWGDGISARPSCPPGASGSRARCAGQIALAKSLALRRDHQILDPGRQASARAMPSRPTRCGRSPAAESFHWKIRADASRSDCLRSAARVLPLAPGGVGGLRCSRSARELDLGAARVARASGCARKRAMRRASSTGDIGSPRSERSGPIRLAAPPGSRSPRARGRRARLQSARSPVPAAPPAAARRRWR